MNQEKPVEKIIESPKLDTRNIYSISAKKAGESVFLGFPEQMKIQKKNIPLSDGGEGFLSIMTEILDLKINKLEVTNLHGKGKFECEYGIGKDFIVIEMAKVCGLELIQKNEVKNPLHTTTRGIGEIINHTHNLGFKKFLIGVGGSSTNDAGLGALTELGLNIKCKTKTNEFYEPDTFFGKNLIDFHSWDNKSLIKNIQIEFACDVNSQFTGENGATYVYGPQKGASKDELELLEDGMKRFQKSITDFDLNSISGSGAAGGISGGFMSFFKDNCKLLSGSEMIAKYVNLEDEISKSDLIFSGEGSIDSQSECGKVVDSIEKLCQKYDKKLILICGKTEKKKKNIFDLISTFSLEECMNNTDKCITDIVQKQILPNL
eukprot:gene6748-10913_t